MEVRRPDTPVKKREKRRVGRRAVVVKVKEVIFRKMAMMKTRANDQAQDV
jgi:hypothetical protein